MLPDANLAGSENVSTDSASDIEIGSADGQMRARFVPQANMLCRSLMHGDMPLLPAGRGVEAYADQGKTMGIPLLYPWANRLSARAYSAAGRDVTLPAPEGQ